MFNFRQCWRCTANEIFVYRPHAWRWSNTGSQKQHISPQATDANQCPWCHTVPETHKHWYELLLATSQASHAHCPGLQSSTTLLWLLTAMASKAGWHLPDISHIPNAQKELVATALSEQLAIGWDLCFRKYLSRHWVLAVAACPFLPPTDECPTASLNFWKTWAHKSISHLWEFAHEMWTHRNSALHNSALPDCHQMKGVGSSYKTVEGQTPASGWLRDHRMREALFWISLSLFSLLSTNLVLDNSSIWNYDIPRRIALQTTSNQGGKRMVPSYSTQSSVSAAAKASHDPHCVPCS
jgi:hypothetical protein